MIEEELDLRYIRNGMSQTHAVAIVGLGPKGLYCLERLLSEFYARPLKQPLHIHVFNRSATFGASPVYDPQQPDYILVNISVGEIDLWTANDPPIVAGRGPDFLTWYQERLQPRKPLNGEEYLPRAVVGRYLIEGFNRIRDHLPDGVRLSCHHGEVTDIEPSGTGYWLEFAAAEGHVQQIAADKILLSTGHSRLRPGKAENSYHEFARRHPRAAFVPYVYPAKETMRSIPTGAKVAMKGVGLTFIDAVLELTEGRGGHFYRTGKGALAYAASGKEPQSIIPFSRTGLPMAPKSYDLLQFDRPLTFLDGSALATLHERLRDRKLDLENDLWPLLEAEMELNYYRVAMGSGEWRQQLDSCGKNADEMRSVIESFHRACLTTERFDYRSVLDPAEYRHFADGSVFVSFVEQYMEAEIARARLGQAGSAIKAAIEIWYEWRKVLSRFIQFGGLTPASHRKLVEYWFPRFKRVVFGPPIVNIEKPLALCKAGILDFSVARNPAVSLDESSGCFRICSDAISGAARSAEILVDARYPPVDIPQDASPLYRNLCARGMIRAYENRETGLSSSTYSPGAIDMTEGSRYVIRASGQPNEDIAVIGIPTEGNLVGNLTVARDEYSSRWAMQVIEQLRCRERRQAAVLDDPRHCLFEQQ